MKTADESPVLLSGLEKALSHCRVRIYIPVLREQSLNVPKLKSLKAEVVVDTAMLIR